MFATHYHHHARRSFWLFAAVFSFVLFPGMVHSQTSNPAGPAKLSTPLGDLARALPQERGAVAAKRAVPQSGFSMESMPKSARDAVRTGMMRVNANAEVQVYVLMGHAAHMRKAIGVKCMDVKHGHACSFCLVTPFGVMQRKHLHAAAAIAFYTMAGAADD